jgi:hypothetical protein
MERAPQLTTIVPSAHLSMVHKVLPIGVGYAELRVEMPRAPRLNRIATPAEEVAALAILHAAAVPKLALIVLIPAAASAFRNNIPNPAIRKHAMLPQSDIMMAQTVLLLTAGPVTQTIIIRRLLCIFMTAPSDLER